jgi:hypothetical protein
MSIIKRTAFQPATADNTDWILSARHAPSSPAFPSAKLSRGEWLPWGLRKASGDRLVAAAQQSRPGSTGRTAANARRELSTPDHHSNVPRSFSTHLPPIAMETFVPRFYPASAKGPHHVMLVKPKTTSIENTFLLLLLATANPTLPAIAKLMWVFK